MYEEQFSQILVNRDPYSGDANYADLRFAYKGIIESIIQVGVEENKGYVVYQLIEVDESFVRLRAIDYLSEKGDFGNYSKEEIVSAVCKQISTINEYLLRDVQDLTNAYKSMGQEPVFLNPLASVTDLRKRGLLN